MDFKKISVVMMSVSLFSLPVQAEQPAAQEYRQMLQSGTYYLEYSIREYDTSRQLPNGTSRKLKPGEDNQEDIAIMKRTKETGMMVSIGMVMSSGMPTGTGITFAVINNGKDRIQNFKKIVKKRGIGMPIPFANVEIGGKQKTYLIPRIMYKQGKYYRFSAKDSSMALQFERKPDYATMLSETDMNSPELDPTEGWGTIRSELSLPIEFAIFNFQDAFNDNRSIVESPVFQESMQRSIGKNIYECDKYISREKDGANEKLTSFVYYAMYKEGKLFLIQKYRIKDNGEEEISEETYVRAMSGQLPEGSFTFPKAIPVYAAGMGDVNDFLGIPVKVGTLGGGTDGK